MSDNDSCVRFGNQFALPATSSERENVNAIPNQDSAVKMADKGNDWDSKISYIGEKLKEYAVNFSEGCIRSMFREEVSIIIFLPNAGAPTIKDLS